MTKRIDGRRYDTNAATQLAVYEPPIDVTDANYYTETLYRKKSGEYFLHGEGGSRSCYATPVGLDGWRGGEKIVPLSEESARKWVEESLDADTYERIFGTLAEPDTAITVYLPPDILAQVDAAKTKGGRSAVIINALRAYFN